MPTFQNRQKYLNKYLYYNNYTGQHITVYDWKQLCRFYHI